MQITSKTELGKIRTLQFRALILVSFVVSHGVIYNHLTHYGLSASSILFGLLPFAVYVARPETQSYRYALPAVLTLLAFAFTGMEVWLLLALGFTCFFIVESKLGKLNKAAPIALFLVLPRVGYLFDVFSFPIRLKLTNLVGNILKTTGLPNTVHGNIIATKGEIFTVDTACMGLYMMTVGLFAVCLLLAYFEKKHEVRISWGNILIFLLWAVGGVILANFIRILLIIRLQAYEGTIAHELIGLLSLVLVVMMPAYFLIQKKIRHHGKSVPMFPKNSPWLRREIKMSLNALLIFGLLFFNLKLLYFTDNELLSSPKVQPIGYEVLELPNRILQLSSARSLVYIKHQDAYRMSNHDPLLCWKASGYEIIYENLMQIDQQDVFVAEMNLEGKKYYGAWWYDNGKHKTISQLDWRWRSMVKRESYNIINVTCRNPKDLRIETQKLLGLNLFGEVSEPLAKK